MKVSLFGEVLWLDASGAYRQFARLGSKGPLASPDCNVKIGNRDVIPYSLYGGRSLFTVG